MRSALMVVDVQNGVVAGIEDAPAVVSRIAALVDSARAAGVPVVWVQHEDADLPRDGWVWQIVPQLAPGEHDVRVVKHHRSAFAGTGLAAALRTRGVEHVVLTGAQSMYCVDMAGKHALVEGFNVTLVSDGHCNGAMDTPAGVVSDAQARALVNRTWSTLQHPDATVQVRSAVEITW